MEPTPPTTVRQALGYASLTAVISFSVMLLGYRWVMG